jgi:hypothetical protein
MINEKVWPFSNATYREAFDFYLGRIHHEDTLIGQRLGWLLTSQSIFWGAYLALLGQDYKPNVLLLAPIAVFLCFLNYFSILAAIVAIYNFCRQLDEQFPQYSEFSKLNILGRTRTHLFGQASPILAPLGFITAWIVVLSQLLLELMPGGAKGNQLAVVMLATFAVLIILLGIIRLWRKTFPYSQPLLFVTKRKR